jgi:hypothetical protein
MANSNKINSPVNNSNDSTTNSYPTREVEPVEVEETTQIVEEKLISYQIVKEANIRYDNATSYYILINSIDRSNSDFKSDIKEVLVELTKIKGSKISVEFFDNAEALESSYEYRINLNSSNVSESIEAERLHLIATFSGELKTNLYLNQLDFFSGASESDPDVGIFVESIEYKP